MKGQKVLNERQKAALAHVAAADDAYKQAKKYEMAEAKRIATERIQAYRLKLDEAVFEAVEMGVPKTRVGEEGLGTKNPYTVLDAYARQLELIGHAPAAFAEKPRDKFSWGHVKIIRDPQSWIAWVLVEGDEIQSTLAEETHPGIGVMAKQGLRGVISYAVTKGTELTWVNDSREKYPELTAWLDENPPEKEEED